MCLGKHISSKGFTPHLKMIEKETVRGVGDIVHAIVAPVAKAIDSLAGTDLENCEKCSERRDVWNEKLPMPESVMNAANSIRTVITDCLNCGRK